MRSSGAVRPATGRATNQKRRRDLTLDPKRASLSLPGGHWLGRAHRWPGAVVSARAVTTKGVTFDGDRSRARPTADRP